MGPNLVVVRRVGLENAAQVRFAEHQNVIWALAPSRTNEPLDVSILPGRTRRDWMIADAHGTNPPGV